MNSKSVYRKKRVGSCLALCLIGAVMSSTMSIPAWAAPASGTAKDDNTVVRDAIKGTPVGSLNANQEVKVKSEQKSEDGYTWYQISFDWNGAQTEGWVRGDLITDGASAADSTQTGSTTDQAVEAAGSVTSNNSPAISFNDNPKVQYIKSARIIQYFPTNFIFSSSRVFQRSIAL